MIYIHSICMDVYVGLCAYLVKMKGSFQTPRRRLILV